MDKKIPQIIYILAGIVIGVLGAKYFEIAMFVFSSTYLILLGAFAIGSFIIVSLIYIALKSSKDAPHALGLPQGSVRAIIALSIVVFFMLTSLVFYLEPGEKPDLAEQILTILGTLMIAVSSFYFGIKATEQGSRIALQTFEKSRNETSLQQNVPPKIILEAIAENKEKWIKMYGCKDVKMGKKETQNTPFDLNCILFLVESKAKPESEETQEIPAMIPYLSNGTEYIIPTDVKLADATAEAENLNKDALTLDIVEELIIENKTVWMEKYGADAISASLKIKGTATVSTPCVQFIVKDKYSLPENAEQIPGHFEYKGFKVPTDVKEEDEPTADTTEIRPGDGASRQGSTAAGTIGIKVFREESGQRQDYLLSCYHVFCNPELKKGKTEFTGTSDSAIVLNSGDAQTKIGNVVDGSFDSNPGLDAAIAKIEDGINAEARLKGFPQTPKHGIRLISNIDVQNRMSVFTYGSVSKSGAGKVLARKIDRTISFFGKTYHFEDVIPTTKISVPGDSGAMVADSKGKVVGIVFASNSTTSYVIPISAIISKFKIRIYYV